MMFCSQRCSVIMSISCIPFVHADKWTLKVHILSWGFVFPKANCNTTTATLLRWEPLLITFTLQIKSLFWLPCFKSQLGVQFACRIQTSPCLGSSSDWGVAHRTKDGEGCCPVAMTTAGIYRLDHGTSDVCVCWEKEKHTHPSYVSIKNMKWGQHACRHIITLKHL